MRKRIICILLTVILMFGLCACDNGPKIPVISVAELLGIGPMGVAERFSGIVEAGQTVNVDRDVSMEVSMVEVKAGDAVTQGQVLFSYDTQNLSIEVERQQLELEQTNNTITTKKSQISTLEKEQKSAASTEKLQYTLQIQQLQLDVKELEYTVTSKQKEIDRNKMKLADASVKSPVAGRIKEVNAGDNAIDPNTGEPLPFISITQEGDLRIRGTLNELSVQSLSEGTPVVIRSRMDETTYWKGTVATIDWENPVKSDNMYYYSPTDEMTTSSKYPFYVKLASEANLMLGQHVYIEPDLGQTEVDQDAGTFYLPSYYLNELGSDTPWVWAVGKHDKLEKRTVTLGNYDMDLDSYEIMEGLALEDFIAYPEEDCKEGSDVRYPDEPVEEDELSNEENPEPPMDGDFTGEEFTGEEIGGDEFTGEEVIDGEVIVDETPGDDMSTVISPDSEGSPDGQVENPGFFRRVFERFTGIAQGTEAEG